MIATSWGNTNLMKDHIFILLQALYHRLILIVNWLYLFVKFNSLCVSPSLNLFSLSVVSPWGVTLCFKVLVGLSFVNFDLTFNILDNRIRRTTFRQHEIFEFFLLHVIKGMFVKWSSSQFLHLAMTQSILTLLSYSLFTAKLLPQLCQLDTAFIIVRNTFWDLIATRRCLTLTLI